MRSPAGGTRPFLRDLKAGRRFVLLAFLCVVAPLSIADVYKWKDADGKTHISDRPPPGHNAERLKIRSFDGPPAGAGDGGGQAHAKVVMLSASWCGVCNRARSWLTQHGIPFTEYDIERTESGKAEFRRLAGAGVPIILIGDRRMDGFSAERLQTMLQGAE